MTSSILLTATFSLLVCLGALTLQRRHNHSLRQEIAQVTENRHSSITSSAPSLHINKISEEINPEERVQEASKEIMDILSSAKPGADPRFFLLSALPDLLTAVEDFEAHELRLLKAELKTILKAHGKKFSEIARLVDNALSGIISEQDPEALLSMKLKDGKPSYKQMQAFASLTKIDPTAAMNWLDTHELSDKSKSKLHLSILKQLLMEDGEHAVQAIRQYGLPKDLRWNVEGPNLLPIPATQLTKLQDAFLRDENADIRPQLGLTIIQSIFAKDITAARAEAARLNLKIDDLTPIFRKMSFRPTSQPKALLTWLMEEPHQNPDLLSNALMTWTHQDIQAAGDWLNTLEPGPKRDTAIGPFASQALALTKDPSAFEWIQQIQNPQLRKKSFTRLMKSWKRRDPDAATAWEKENPGQNE